MFDDGWLSGAVDPSPKRRNVVEIMSIGFALEEVARPELIRNAAH